MWSADEQNQGLYQPGTSLLHRLDPRVKLLLQVALVISLFAAPDPVRLTFLAGVAVVALITARVSLQQVLARVWLLRWLLLFGLLLHVLLTPGRTLWGTSWLSLDGLLRGLTLDLQLVLALLLSYLLALSTPPTALAEGLSRLLAPLQRLGVPVREWGGLMLLVLHFLPLVRSETSQLDQRQGRNFFDRLRSLVGLVGPLLVRLVERADDLAREIVVRRRLAEDRPQLEIGRLQPLDWGCLGGGLILLLLLWIV